MREILFRGKRTDGTGWIEGFYFQKPTPNSDDGRPVYHGITDLPPFDAEVIPETVGQYTGLKDKNGKRIFEGDIVRIGSGIFEFTGQVVFEQESFQLVDPECDVYECMWYQAEEMTVLGNIRDNPELLEVEG